MPATFLVLRIKAVTFVTILTACCLFAAAKSDYFKIVKEAKDEFRFTDRELDRLGYYHSRSREQNINHIAIRLARPGGMFQQSEGQLAIQDG